MDRVKKHGEVMTPPELVEELLDQVPLEKWQDDSATFLDNSCGTGNFLVAVYNRLRSYGHSRENALSRIHGCELLLDNMVECIRRLYGSEPEWWDYEGECWRWYSPEWLYSVTAMFRVEGRVLYNFACCDALQYHYRFDGTHPYGEDEWDWIFEG